MKIVNQLEDIPNIPGAVITVGSFDGVHQGHRKIFENLKKIAAASNGKSVVITFHPHPRKIIYPKDDSLRLLSTLEEKIQLIKEVDVDYLIIVPFSIEFSQIDPREYVENFLIKYFNPETVILGYDHRFGLNRQGDITLLKKYADRGIFKLEEIEKEEIDHIAISSTKIRESIGQGDMNTANRFLSYAYMLTGKVIHGEKKGRELGYPTANLRIEDKAKLLPCDGIYAVEVFVEEVQYQGMMYIGNKPTLTEGIQKVIEVNIFDYEGVLYGSQIQVRVIDFIREDKKFENLGLLKAALATDKIRSLEILNHNEALRSNVSKIAIAILNYNGKGFLESYLPSVLESSDKYDLEYWVIDNGSTDKSVKYLKKWHPEVKLCLLPKNLGFADGYNQGIKSINAEYIVFLNSDVKTEPNWLDPIIEMLDQDRTIGAIQPKILSLENPKYFEYAGASGGFIDALGYPYCRGRVLEHVEADNGQYDDAIEVFWTSGAAMVMRKRLFVELGGFAQNFFAHQEEIDLCWRINKCGYKCMVQPKSVVYHLGGGNLDYGSPHKTMLNFRNNINMLLRNASSVKLLWLIPLRLILDSLAALRYLLGGNLSQSAAIFKAWGMVLVSIFKISTERQAISKTVEKYSISDSKVNTQRVKSILWSYYILGKKNYNSLTTP